MKKLCLKNYLSSLGFLLGVCLTTCGLLYFILEQTLISYFMQQKITLRPNTEIFHMWKYQPVKVVLDYYLFNWTNPEDFRNPSIKPKFQQLGPYRFLEKQEKYDIVWHPENKTVSYRKRTFYYFDEEGSVGKLSDPVTTLNFIATGGIQKSAQWSFFLQGIVKMALKVYGDRLYFKATAEELLYKGYPDLLLNLGEKALPMLENEIIPFDKYGFAYKRNGSSSIWGHYNIHTGEGDLTQIGQIHTWNYKENTKIYKAECGMVNGTAGEFQSINLKKNKPLTYFVSDLCRSISVDYEEELDWEGVTAYKYILGKRAVDNGTLYPENKCFCVGECIPSGLIPVGPCWVDTPLYVSYPHFYNADPIYLNNIEGLKPEKALHESYVVYEPQTGFTLEINGKLQLNARVVPQNMPLFQGIPHMYFPMFWAEERVRIPAKFVTELKMFKFVVDGGGKFFSGLFCVLGLTLIIRFIKIQFFNNRLQVVNFNQLHEVHCENGKTLCKDSDNGKAMYPLLKKSVLDVRIVNISVDQDDDEEEEEESDKVLNPLTGSISTLISSNSDLVLSDGDNA